MSLTVRPSVFPRRVSSAAPPVSLSLSQSLSLAQSQQTHPPPLTRAVSASQNKVSVLEIRRPSVLQTGPHSIIVQPQSSASVATTVSPLVSAPTASAPAAVDSSIFAENEYLRSYVAKTDKQLRALIVEHSSDILSTPLTILPSDLPLWLKHVDAVPALTLAYETVIQSQQKQIQETQQQVDAANHRLNAVEAELTRVLTHFIHFVEQTQSESLVSADADDNAEIRLMREQCDIVTAMNERLAAENSALQAERSVQRDLSANDVADQNRLNVAEAEVQRLVEERQQLLSDMDVMIEEVSKAEARERERDSYDRLRGLTVNGDTAQVIQERNDAVNAVAVYKQTVEELRSKYTTDIQTLRDKYTAAETNAVTATARLETITRERDNAITECKTMSSTLNTTIDSIQNECNALRIENQRVLFEVGSERDRLQRDREDDERARENNERQRDYMNQQVQELRTKLSTSQAELSVFTERLNTINRIENNHTNELASVRLSAKNATDALKHQLHDAIQSHNRDISAVNKRLSDTTAALHESQEQLSALQSSHTMTLNRLKAFESDQSEAEADIGRRQRELHHHRSQLEQDYQHRHTQLDRQSREIMSECHSAVEAMTAKMSAMESELVRVQRLYESERVKADIARRSVSDRLKRAVPTFDEFERESFAFYKQIGLPEHIGQATSNKPIHAPPQPPDLLVDYDNIPARMAATR